MLYLFKNLKWNNKKDILYTVVHKNIWTLLIILSKYIYMLYKIFWNFISTTMGLNYHDYIRKGWNKSVDRNYKIFSTNIYFTEITKFILKTNYLLMSFNIQWDHP